LGRRGGQESEHNENKPRDHLRPSDASSPIQRFIVALFRGFNQKHFIEISWAYHELWPSRHVFGDYMAGQASWMRFGEGANTRQ
jgi:hypothetical protein